MTYEYLCEKCGHLFDVIKSLKDIDKKEECHTCGNIAERQFSANVHFIGTAVQSAEYNPGLGCVVKNKHHREEIAKRKGLIEVGSDYGTGKKMQKSFDADRKKKQDKRWDDV